MPRPVAFDGASGNKLRGDAFGNPAARPIILLHGGGQTRHSWNDTASILADDGWQVVNLDQRGHGDSDWSKDGDYSSRDYAADLVALSPQLPTRPVFVGASLGGIAALIAEGLHEGPFAVGLVLVDVAPRIESAGAARIMDFMRAHPDGFATLDECADAVAAYNPHRPRPKSSAGLAKNLRKGEDGRWRWHWDPGFVSIDQRNPLPDARVEEIARSLEIPTLLVRGRLSDLLSAEGAQEFLDLVPHARFTDVSDAGHMVAGDNNDVFTTAIRNFLEEEIEP